MVFRERGAPSGGERESTAMLRNKRGLTVVVSVDEEEDEGPSVLSNGERVAGVTADDGEEETWETLLDLLRWRRELEL